jgi:hypothetical protein
VPRSLLAALAAAALALPVPHALADEPVYGCDYTTALQQQFGGSNYEAAAFGWVVHAGSAVTIRCTIESHGYEYSGTPTAAGDSVAVTAGRVSLVADQDFVVCAHVTVSGHDPITDCHQGEHYQVPPEVFFDLYEVLNDLVIAYVDPTICAVLDDYAGTYGPVTINEQGDVFVLGEPQWDCPPYDIFGT